MTDQTALTIAGIGIMLAVPVTFMFANWIRKNVDYGEAQFPSAQEQDEAGDRDK